MYFIMIMLYYLIFQSMGINVKIKATFCGGTGSKQSMNKSTVCTF